MMSVGTIRLIKSLCNRIDDFLQNLNQHSLPVASTWRLKADLRRFRARHIHDIFRGYSNKDLPFPRNNIS